MRTTIIVVMALLLGATTTYAGAKLQKGEEFASVSFGNDNVTIFKVVDVDTTCYVSKAGKNAYHAISCVK